MTARRVGWRSRPALRWLSALRIAFLFGGAAMALLLVFDARYRGFPWPLYALPLMSLLLLLVAGFRTRVFDREEAVLASIILVCALAIIPLERLSNVQALTVQPAADRAGRRGYRISLLATSARAASAGSSGPRRGLNRTRAPSRAPITAGS